MGEHGHRVKVWDLPLRVFHWTLVLVIALAFLSSEEESVLNDWHVRAGWVAAILIMFRLVWGFVGGEHSRFIDFIRPSRIPHHLASLARGHGEPSLGHNPLGAVAVVVLLALVATAVWTGAFGGEAAEEAHELIAWVLLAMVAMHVVAVILMSMLGRENLVRAMVTGNKPAARHPGATDAMPPTAAAWLLAAAIIGATSYLITRYDPAAFTPRSSESFEHRPEVTGYAIDAGREEIEDD